MRSIAGIGTMFGFKGPGLAPEAGLYCAGFGAPKCSFSIKVFCMNHAAQVGALAHLRQEIVKSVAELKAIERTLRDIARRLSTSQLESLTRRIEAARTGR